MNAPAAYWMVTGSIPKGGKRLKPFYEGYQQCTPERQRLFALPQAAVYSKNIVLPFLPSMPLESLISSRMNKLLAANEPSFQAPENRRRL